MIWIMAGTSDSKLLINALSDMDKIITITTKQGTKAFIDYPETTIQKMNATKMESFIKKNKITLIIDTTHPFAVEASENAIKVSKKKNIPYVRFERPGFHSKEKYFYNDYNSIISELSRTTGNILLTIGIKNLHKFNRIDKERLFIKVLSNYSSIEECKKNNVPEINLIALKGIVSVNLFREIIKEYKIRHMVMKESGAQGGTDLKWLACKKEKVIPYILKRPAIEYPLCFSQMGDLICYIRTQALINS